jgi:hypothetical protein
MNSRGAEKGVSDSRFTITLRNTVVYVKSMYYRELYISCVRNKDIVRVSHEIATEP